MMTHDDRGEGGVKNFQNGGDVICGCPHIQFDEFPFKRKSYTYLIFFHLLVLYKKFMYFLVYVYELFVRINIPIFI